MKAFKGCTNPSCKSYKKIHYKKDDDFCTKCGSALSYVCAACWKPLEDESFKYCISCKAEKEQKQAKIVDTAKHFGGGLVAAAVAVPSLVKNVDKLAIDLTKLSEKAAEVVKYIK